MGSSHPFAKCAFHALFTFGLRPPLISISLKLHPHTHTSSFDHQDPKTIHSSPDRTKQQQLTVSLFHTRLAPPRPRRGRSRRKRHGAASEEKIFATACAVEATLGGSTVGRWCAVLRHGGGQVLVGCWFGRKTSEREAKCLEEIEENRPAE